MTRAGRKTDAATTLLMVLLILTAAKLLLERLLALMLPHDLHQNTRLLLSMAQETLLVGLPALLMRRGRSARTGTMRLNIGLLLCAAVLGLGIWALMTLPRTAKMRMKRGHIMLSAAILLLMAVQYLL